MKKIQKTHEKQYLDLPYDCLGEIFYFYLEDVYDFFTIIYTCNRELSSLVCYYADNVEFTLFSIPSINTINSKKETHVKRKFGGVNEKIILAVKILRVKLYSSYSNLHEDRLIDFLKLFKNIKKISFGLQVSVASDKMLKMLSTTSLESLSFTSASGLTLLPKSVKELDISFSKITDKDLFHFPKCLLEVDIGGCGKVTCEGFKTLFKDSVIEKLLAGNTSICNTSLSFLPKTLKELDISGCYNISDEGIKHLTKTNLKKLSISSCENITKEGFSFLPEAIEELDSSGITYDEYLKEISKFRIKKLDCAYCLITNKGLQFMPSTLKALDLTGCGFNNLDNINIKNFGSIEELILCDCEYLSNEGIKNLVKFKNLKKLDLECCYEISDEGMEFVPNTLKELDIFGVKITNLKFLKKFKNLERFASDSDIDTTNLKFIPQKLSWLNLYSNRKLTDEGLKKLQCLENLTYLNINKCDNITNNGVYYVIKKSAKLKEFSFRDCSSLNCTKEQIRQKFPGRIKRLRIIL